MLVSDNRNNTSYQGFIVYNRISIVEGVVQLKKLFFVLLAITILSGCSSTDGTDQVESEEVASQETQELNLSDKAIQERDEFIEAYNEIVDNSEDNSDYIEIDNIEAPELDSEGDTFSQDLLNKEGKNISVVYSGDGAINGFRVLEKQEENVPINLAFVSFMALNLAEDAYTEKLTQIIVSTDNLNNESFNDSGYEVDMVYAESENILTTVIVKEN
ncbi:hypothetical protein [Radiobacillus sp. PE A8.2]|uniref:hypothetical protein n=1 Tax=Radiobacillus sp. PE A8.2 TaxID=3380349 RepID=UPI00388F314F